MKEKKKEKENPSAVLWHEKEIPQSPWIFYPQLKP